MTKRILSLIIAISLILCINISFVRAEEDNSFLDYCDISIKLGLVDNKISGETKVTRADLAKAAVGLRNYNVEAYNFDSSPFSDVTVENKEVIIAADTGLMSGYGDGTFKPEQNATMYEVLSVFIRVSGHDAEAQVYGGFPDGYLKTANRLEITEKLVAVEGDVSYSNFAKLIENTLNADYADAFEHGEKTVLNQFFDIYWADGRVTAQGKSALTGYAETLEGQMSIDGNIYDANGIIEQMDVAAKFENYVGYTVRYYYREIDDKENELVHVAIKKKLNMKTIYASQLNKDSSQYTMTSIVAYSNNKNVVYDLLPNVEVFYNDVNYYDYTLESIKPQNGKIVLIDADGDNIYEVVKVYEYDNYIVKQVNIESQTIYDYYGRRIEFDLDEESNYIIDLQGESYSLEDLKAWDVLSVFESKNGDAKRARIVRNKVIGTISGIGEKFYISGDSAAYELSGDYMNLVHANKVNLAMGLSGQFYLDIEGKVCGIKHSDNLLHYGYLFNIYPKEYIDDEEPVRLKIVTENGAITSYNAKKKLRVNNANAKNYELLSNPELVNLETKEAIPQLIKFSVNDEGEINKLYYYDVAYTGENALIKNVTLSSAHYMLNAGMFNSEWVISDTSKVFTIPSSEEIEEKTVNVGSKTMFANNSTYSNLSFYDCDSANQAGAVVCGLIPTGATSDHVFVFDKAQEELNEDDEVVTIMYGYVNGKAVSYYVDDESLIAGYEAGDCLRVQYYSKNNYVNSVQNCYFDVSEQAGTSFAIQMGKFETAGGVERKWSSDRVYYGGKVGAVYDNAFVVNTKEILNDSESGALKPRTVTINSGTIVYIVDYSEKKNRVKVAKYADIISESNEGIFNGDYVFIKRTQDIARDIIVVRNY